MFTSILSALCIINPRSSQPTNQLRLSEPLSDSSIILMTGTRHPSEKWNGNHYGKITIAFSIKLRTAFETTTTTTFQFLPFCWLLVNTLHNTEYHSSNYLHLCVQPTTPRSLLPPKKINKVFCFSGVHCRWIKMNWIVVTVSGIRISGVTLFSFHRFDLLAALILRYIDTLTHWRMVVVFFFFYNCGFKSSKPRQQKKLGAFFYTSSHMFT